VKRKHHNPTGAWPSSETPDAPPLAERILNRLKNIRIVAYAIVLGTLLVGFTTLFEAFSKLIAAIPEKQRSVANYDLKTEESALQVARLIDDFFSRLAEPPPIKLRSRHSATIIGKSQSKFTSCNYVTM